MQLSSRSTRFFKANTGDRIDILENTLYPKRLLSISCYGIICCESVWPTFRVGWFSVIKTSIRIWICNYTITCGIKCVFSLWNAVIVEEILNIYHVSLNIICNYILYIPLRWAVVGVCRVINYLDVENSAITAGHALWTLIRQPLAVRHPSVATTG